ncbi:hypothetical protein [Cohnella sp. REN36]|uniref:hypothetical protein n=1 Tax=Cohnella sp. REN36 TaxID=2887347 RepID=UPI001D134F3F|nr:hypothetical protein [Cohnella sp. REN36]MCC3375107.1 hypothetical protein [Cohnella sp. REN36]
MLTLIVLVLGRIGHTQWNFERQLHRQLNALHSPDQVNYVSDLSAIQEISAAKRPLSVRIVSQAKDSELYAQNLVVDIEGKRYEVRLICYTYPFSRAFFEKWTLIQINEIV